MAIDSSDARSTKWAARYRNFPDAIRIKPSRAQGSCKVTAERVQAASLHILVACIKSVIGSYIICLPMDLNPECPPSATRRVRPDRSCYSHFIASCMSS